MCFEGRRQNTKTRKHSTSDQPKTRKHENTGILSRKHTKTRNLGKILLRRAAAQNPNSKERRAANVSQDMCSTTLALQVARRGLYPRWSPPNATLYGELPRGSSCCQSAAGLPAQTGRAFERTHRIIVGPSTCIGSHRHEQASGVAGAHSNGEAKTQIT